jgi:DNA-binding response OmpR family regulator
LRLLIVDDDRALRDALRRALNLAGYEVLGAW